MAQDTKDISLPITSDGTAQLPADWSQVPEDAFICISCLDMLGTVPFPEDLLIHVVDDTGDE